MNLWAHEDGRLLVELNHATAFFRQAIFPMGDFAKGRPMAYPTFTTDTAIPDGFAPLYTKAQSDQLLAEQAHRYQQDLSRLGDERDEAVAQHDRDAETIAELREIAKWLVAEEMHWKVQSRKRHVALEDAVRSLPISSFSQDYTVHPPKAEITLNKVTRLAERHRDDCLKYEKLIEASLDALLLPGPYGNLPDAVRRVVAERDEARGLLAAAEGAAATLPDPDAQNPEHLRWAADFLALCGVRDGKARVTNDFGRALAHSGNSLIERAQRIEADQERAAADEKLIEQAAQVMSDSADRGSMSLSWDRLPDSIRDGWRHNARALHAAGLLALDAARAEAGQ